MESPRGKALNPQEKAQLKQKLALLKREYRRTFHRLQRAERAERVKTYVKRTVAEQNLLLVQGENEKDHAGSTISQEGIAVSNCPTVSPAKTASVTFKPEPEVFSQEDSSLPSTPVSKCTGQDCRKVLFGPLEPLCENNQGHLSRSRTRAQERPALPLEKRGEPACEALWREPECQPEQRASTSTGGSQSPVFQRRSGGSSVWEAVLNLSAATMDGSSCESTPLVLQPECVQETPTESLFPEDSCLFPCSLSCESRVPSLDCPYQGDFCISSEDSAGENALSQEDLQNDGKGAAQMGEGQAQSREEDPDLGRFADSVVGLGGRGTTPGVPGAIMHEEGRPGEEPQAPGFCGGDSSPTSKSRARGLGEELEPDSSLLEEQVPPTNPAEKALSSYTVVEGLLFPVEYYVRTTRRMSSHQKEVNWEAVIQNQLGRSKKGQKVTRKERNTGPALSSQEEARNAGQPEALPCSPPVASPSLQPSWESPVSNGGHAPREGHLQARRRGRPRKGARHQASFSPSQDPLDNSEVADDSFVSSETQGREEDGPGRSKATETSVVVGGCVGGRRRGRKGPREGRSHGTELEILLNSAGVPEAEPASGFERDLEEEDCERPVWQRNPPQQPGSQNQDGTKVAQQDKASLSQKEREAPQGGRGRLSNSLSGPGAACPVLPFCSQRDEASHPRWLPPASLDFQEFCLPEDEFGFLKSEKLKAWAVKEAESLAAEGLPCAADVGHEKSALGEGLSDIVRSATQKTSATSPFSPCLHQRGLSLSELLLSPALQGVSCPLSSPLPSLAFPMVGTTPASPALSASQVSPEVFCTSPWQAKAGAAGEPGTLVETSPSFPKSGTRRQRQLQSQPKASWLAEKKAASLEERQLMAGESLESSNRSPKENEGLEEGLVEASAEGILGGGNLQMTSKLKGCSGSSSVDVGTVWWEAADFTALCVVVASETSVSLWRPLDADRWAVVHTWNFTKVAVIQIIPLPGVCSLVCVALGCLEIAEIRFLFHSSEGDSVNQSLVKAGDIKAVLGLRRQRLVTSCGSLRDQEVEVVSFSELGRSNERWTLMPPEETVSAFAEVDGMLEALVGMTAMNCLMVWNLKSGQLLRKMSLGCSYPASVCHRAYADSGLLFVVLSHLHAKESKAHGIPAFQVVALNPRTGKSTILMVLSLPRGTGGRYLEGEVRDASAVAVLTSGTIAVWDLFLGQCTAVLPPNSEGNWSLVRWSVTDTSLLAGQNDGSVSIYSYTSRRCSA